MLKHFAFLLFLSSVVILNGCVSTVYQGKDFPATKSLKIFPANQLPSGYTQIGIGRASGEFSGTTNEELCRRLQKTGMKHGAEAMIIIGTRLVPDGKVVNDAQYNFIEATDDPDQTASEINRQELISSDPNAGSTRYLRVMYVKFLRKKVQ